MQVWSPTYSQLTVRSINQSLGQGFDSLMLHIKYNSMKKKFSLQTWGGFYNKEYKDIHGYEEGKYYFDTEEEMNNYITELKKKSEELNARMLMIHTCSGFYVDIPKKIHAVIKNKDTGEYREEVREVLDDFEVSTMAYTAKYKFEPYLEENEEIDSIYFSGVFPIEEINYF